MASGRPDWYSSVAMHGKCVNDYITVAVDIDGNMLGIMQGEGPGGLATIALDAAGNMKANLFAQDLGNIITLSSMGAADIDLQEGNYATSGTKKINDHEGKLNILGGYCRFSWTTDIADCPFKFAIDDQSFRNITPNEMIAAGYIAGQGYWLSLTAWDPTNKTGGVVLGQPMATDSDYYWYFENPLGNTFTYVCVVHYAIRA